MLTFLFPFTNLPESFFLHLEGNMLPVQSSSIRPVFGPKNFYESIKTCCCIPEEEGHSRPYIPGRLSSFGCNSGRSCEKYSACSDSPSVPRFYNKPQEIITDSNTSDNLPGFPNRLNVHHNITTGRKGQQDPRLLSPSARSQSITLRNLASLIGLLESSRPAIWRAPLHFRHSQSDLIRGLQMNQEFYDALITLLSSARVELAWWLKHTLNTSGSPVHLTPPDMIITTDASKKGWGAVHQSLQTNGRWSQKESLQHINYLELKAAFLALKAFLKGKSHVTVSLQLDNTTAISYINNKGGTRSPQLMTLALEMWDWCQARDILVIASHIPGGDNVSADKEFREFRDMSEWKLDPTIIQPFLLNCQTDLFASRLTNQLQNYISWRPDPGAIHADAFTIDWAPLQGYAFPPLNLISKTLTKVTTDQTELILVAPVWQAQPWWPVLLRLLISQPVLLPNSPTLLTDPTDLNRVHPMYPRLHLAVFHISTNVSKLRAFQQTLPIYSSQQLVPPHTKPTSLAGIVGAAGVLDGKLILFRHL